MALQNCTINSSSVLVTPSQALGSGVANQVLTITPNTGYRVDASLFTNNSGTLTGVTSIALSNSGTGYAENNTVLVTVDLDNSFNPGTTDQTITIDIDGKAILEKDIPKTLSGEYTVNSSANVTPADGAVEDVTYTATAETGTTVDLFTQAVTANTGYYFSTEPVLKILSGDVSNYSVTKTLGYDGNNNLNSASFNVDGIIPLENDTNDQISITANAIAVPPVVNAITAYSINTDDAPYALTKRGFTAYGTVGARFTLQIVNTAGQYYNFTTKAFQSGNTNSGTLTIGSNGQYVTLIELPLVLADTTYTFTIAAVSPSTLSLNSSQSNPFTINRRGFKSITVNATSTSRGTFQSKVITYTNYAGSTITQSAGANATYNQSGFIPEGENDSEFNFNIVIDDDSAFTFSGANGLSNSITLTNSHFSSTGNASVSPGTTTATRANDSQGNTNQKLTIAGTGWYTNQFGTNNHVITFNIDEFCNSTSGGGTTNVLTIGTTQFQDVTGGNASILYPQGFIQQVTGRTSGSSTITYTLAGINLSGNDFPSYVDTTGDVTITAGNYGATTTKFNSATYSASLTSFSVTNAGTSSRELFMDVTVTITNFSPNVASGDVHALKVMIAFANDGATP